MASSKPGLEMGSTKIFQQVEVNFIKILLIFLIGELSLRICNGDDQMKLSRSEIDDSSRGVKGNKNIELDAKHGLFAASNFISALSIVGTRTSLLEKLIVEK